MSFHLKKDGVFKNQYLLIIVTKQKSVVFTPPQTKNPTFDFVEKLRSSNHIEG